MKEHKQNTAERVSIKEKLCYGIGDVSHGLALSSVGFWLLIYLTDVAGMGPQIAGIAIMIGRAWDAVTDPLMGWITDHTVSRWGKRRPYLLFGAIPYGIAFAALWMVPDFDKEVFTFAYVTIVLIIFNTSLTVVFVPYTTLTAAITSDYDERTSLTGFRMTASLISQGIGATLPSALIKWVMSAKGAAFFSAVGLSTAFGSWAMTAKQGYLIMGITLACIMILSIWTAFWGTRERSVEEKSSQQTAFSPFHYASSIYEELQGNKPFRISAMILLLTNCAATLVAVNLPYFLHYVVDMRDAQTKIIGTLFATAIVSVPIWVLITKHFGKAETYRVAMLLYVLVLCSLPFVQKDQYFFAYLLAVLAGVFNAAALMIPWAMIPDVVEFDELRTGKRREGLFYGGTTFCYKFATAFAVFFSGTILEWVGYVANEEQTMVVVRGIKGLIGFSPAVLLICGAVLSLRYPLNSARHRLIVEELSARRSG